MNKEVKHQLDLMLEACENEAPGAPAEVREILTIAATEVASKMNTNAPGALRLMREVAQCAALAVSICKAHPLPPADEGEGGATDPSGGEDGDADPSSGPDSENQEPEGDGQNG